MTSASGYPPTLLKGSPMTSACAAIAAPTTFRRGTMAVAVIAPQANSGWAKALARRGHDPVAVTLGIGTRPPAFRCAAADDAFADSVEYDGDLRHTVKKLRMAESRLWLPEAPQALNSPSGSPGNCASPGAASQDRPSPGRTGVFKQQSCPRRGSPRPAR